MQCMKLDIKCVWILRCWSAIIYSYGNVQKSLCIITLQKVAESVSVILHSFSQSSHVTVWHSRSFSLTHFLCVSCLTFLRLAGSLEDAWRPLFIIAADLQRSGEATCLALSSHALTTVRAWEWNWTVKEGVTIAASYVPSACTCPCTCPLCGTTPFIRKGINQFFTMTTQWRRTCECTGHG